MRRLTAPKLVVATHNAGKLAEIAALIGPFGIETISAGQLGLPEPVETEDNFIGNARIKAHAAAQAAGLPALADDSGICVDALHGAPGVYTADWAETADGRDFNMAMATTWDRVQASGQSAPFRAQFRCTLVLAWPDGHDEVFEGVMPGQLVWPMRGDQGHGYDPIFQPDGYDVTFGEMDRWAKNRISHRADAFRKFVDQCLKAPERRLISTGSPFEQTMGYSRAVVQGDWCFLSGVTGYDYQTMKMPKDVAQQAENCFATIAGVLDQAGFAMRDIAQVQYTVIDAGLAQVLAPVLERHLGTIRPAATMIVAGLIQPEMAVEIQVTAFRG